MGAGTFQLPEGNARGGSVLNHSAAFGRGHERGEVLLPQCLGHRLLQAEEDLWAGRVPHQEGLDALQHGPRHLRRISFRSVLSRLMYFGSKIYCFPMVGYVLVASVQLQTLSRNKFMQQ